MKTTKLPKGVYRRFVRGQECYLVYLGRDNNKKQKWKSCATLEEAITERELFLHTKKQQGESLWLLNPQQRADAVAALEILSQHPKETLVNAASYYLQHRLSLLNLSNISKLLDIFISENTETKSVTVVDLRSRLKPFREAFGNKLPDEVTVEDIKKWVKNLQGSALTRRHRINKASSFFLWAVANGYALRNPLDRRAVRRPKYIRSNVAFFSVEQMECIFKVFQKHGLLNYAVLGGFTGIRPEEVRRLRSTHFKVDGDTIVITLDGSVTKTNWRRVVELKRGTPIGDAVWSWLGGNGKLELPVVIAPPLSTFKRKFRKLRGELPFKWIPDGLRHTAATYACKVMSYDDVEKMLGHTTRETLQQHYKGLTTESQALKFYQLRPSHQ